MLPHRKELVVDVEARAVEFPGDVSIGCTFGMIGIVDIYLLYGVGKGGFAYGGVVPFAHYGIMKVLDEGACVVYERPAGIVVARQCDRLQACFHIEAVGMENVIYEVGVGFKPSFKVLEILCLVEIAVE